MMNRLQLVLVMHVVEVHSHTCYAECLKQAVGDTTNVSIMVFDASEDSPFYVTKQWLDRKTMEFNGLYPGIAVTLVHVSSEAVVNEALQDMESGTNKYHAYIMPLMNVHGGTARLADYFMDMSPLIVANVNDVAWHTIGRFYRAHSSLYQGKVVTLPLAGDFWSLHYRQDIFTAHGMSVPRTLKEYVLASQALNGTDLNGDGEPDYGSCFSHVGDLSAELFAIWFHQVLQYRGTSQGGMFDTDTLDPMLENSVVQEAMKLWKEVAGPPELTGRSTLPEVVQLWITGRCAMTIGLSTLYTAFRSALLDATTGIAIMPGSEKVWWREGKEMVLCNMSFCRHATKYEDGLVVNHAPGGQSVIDGTINGQIGKPTQLAAYTCLTWLMNDANMLQAVVNPPSWPNGFVGSFVKPSLLTPSAWAPYGWRDPGLSMFCATSTTNMEHPNAVVGSRLPNAVEYFESVEDILKDFWRGQGDFEELDVADGAVAASESITTALQQVTDRGDRKALIASYRKSLNINVAGATERTAPRGEFFPTWALHAVVGILGGTLCLAFFVFAWWLTMTVRQQKTLRAKQQEAWEVIVDEAELYASSLGCPMALVSATDLFDLGCLVQFESLRDEGRLRFLDTVEKVVDFQKDFIIVFLSHQWLAWNIPGAIGVHYQAMCAAVCRVTEVANVSLDDVFLWVDYCSIPQEHLATRELFLAAVPQYVSLCDFFIVIAPPTAHGDTELDLSTFFRDGWCRAELLSRLLGSGAHRLFLCVACDGSLQQVTREMVRGIDLNVFLGTFRCCSLGHVGCLRCDREKLRTPILGIYARYVRDLMYQQSAAADERMSHVLPNERVEQDKGRMFPRFFEFVTANGDMTSSVQVRELFGPLPEMLEQRIRASGAEQNDFNTMSVVEAGGAKRVREGLRAVSEQDRLLQGSAPHVAGECTGIEKTFTFDSQDEVSDDGMVRDVDGSIENDTLEPEVGIVLDDIGISIPVTLGSMCSCWL